MVLDEPFQKDDHIENIDGITVAVDAVIAGLVTDGIIDIQKVFWMGQLILKSEVLSNC